MKKIYLILFSLLFSQSTQAEEILYTCRGSSSVGYQLVNGTSTFSQFTNPGIFYVIRNERGDLIVSEKMDGWVGLNPIADLLDTPHAYISKVGQYQNIVETSFSMRKADGIFFMTNIGSTLHDPSQRRTVSMDSGVCR